MEFLAPRYSPYIARMKQLVLALDASKKFLIIQVENADDVRRVEAFCRYHGINAFVKSWEYRYRPSTRDVAMLIPPSRRVELYPEAYVRLFHPSTDVFMCCDTHTTPIRSHQ